MIGLLDLEARWLESGLGGHGTLCSLASRQTRLALPSLQCSPPNNTRLPSTVCVCGPRWAPSISNNPPLHCITNTLTGGDTHPIDPRWLWARFDPWGGSGIPHPRRRSAPSVPGGSGLGGTPGRCAGRSRTRPGNTFLFYLSAWIQKVAPQKEETHTVVVVEGGGAGVWWQRGIRGSGGRQRNSTEMLTQWSG